MAESTSYLLGKFVTLLEGEAEHLLHEQLGISYRRMLFLFVLQHQESSTQHQLAQALGYSDPAVSTMLQELVKDGFVTTMIDPGHRRKRVVCITPQGQEIAQKGRLLLDGHFDQLVQLAELDDQQLRNIAYRLLAAISQKTQKEHS